MLAPLVKLEADHDRQAREAQAREDVSVRWDRGLSKRYIAVFARDKNDARATSSDDIFEESHRSARSPLCFHKISGGLWDSIFFLRSVPPMDHMV